MVLYIIRLALIKSDLFLQQATGLVLIQTLTVLLCVGLEMCLFSAS